MSTTTTGSRVKDLVVTAAVASVVSAMVAPWIRRWMDGTGLVPSPVPPPEAEPTLTLDDFDQRLERLLEVPQPISTRAVAAAKGGRAWIKEQANDGKDHDTDR